jgi:DNA-binding transcriptional LysR family regulator
LELNRTRHFGRAADALNLTQAAVSSRLKTLESILGVELFERSRREMRLTPEGGRLIRHAEAQLAAWRAARQDVSPNGSRQMVIGGSLRLWDVLLQPWLHDLRRAFPDIALIMESHTAEHLTRRLVGGTMDVAVMLEPAQLDTLQIREVCMLEFVSSGIAVVGFPSTKRSRIRTCTTASSRSCRSRCFWRKLGCDDEADIHCCFGLFVRLRGNQRSDHRQRQ